MGTVVAVAETGVHYKIMIGPIPYRVGLSAVVRILA